MSADGTLRIEARVRRGAFVLDASFAAKLPGVVALFGRSGCGKSTLVNAIAGLVTPEVGRISLNDVVLFDRERHIDVAPEARRLGYVFQEGRLFPHLRVRGNLAYGGKRSRVSGARIAFDDVVDLLGLAALLDRRPNSLSGGERQRVAIGRALLAQPQLLLLDEPFAALDDARRLDVLPYLERLRDSLRIPMVYVSHDFDEVLRVATHVVLLDSGTVVAQGSPSTMSRDSNLRRIVGPDAISSVVEGVVSTDAGAGLARVSVGSGHLNVNAPLAQRGTRIRMQIMARDVILATSAPQGLSVRNAIEGTVASLRADEGETVLVDVDVGGDQQVTSRVTREAVEALELIPGKCVWALFKAVSLRGHWFAVRD